TGRIAKGAREFVIKAMQAHKTTKRADCFRSGKLLFIRTPNLVKNCCVKYFGVGKERTPAHAEFNFIKLIEFSVTARLQLRVPLLRNAAAKRQQTIIGWSR